MSHCIDETYNSYVETSPKAAKKHMCDACKETIRVGDHYWRVYILFDGQKETVKRCLRCQKIHEHLREMGKGEDMWPAERLDCGEDYFCEWEEDPPPEIQALAFALPQDRQ